MCGDDKACGCAHQTGLLAEAIRNTLKPKLVLAAQTVVIPAVGQDAPEIDWHIPFSAIAVNVVSSPIGGLVTTNGNTFAAAGAATANLANFASLTGFDVSVQPAAATVFGTVTVSGLQTPIQGYTLIETTSGTLLTVRFPQPLPPNAAGGPIGVTVPAIVGGAAGQISVYGQTALTAVQPITIAAATRGNVPTSGVGVAVCPPNKGGIYNVRGHSLTVYGGNPGDQVTVQAFTEPQHVSWG